MLYLVHFNIGACGGGILLSLADPDQEGGKKCVIKRAEHRGEALAKGAKNTPDGIHHGEKEQR